MRGPRHVYIIMRGNKYLMEPLDPTWKTGATELQPEWGEYIANAWKFPRKMQALDWTYALCPEGEYWDIYRYDTETHHKEWITK